MKKIHLILLTSILSVVAFNQTSLAQTSKQDTVIFTGGYETSPVDHGRPVILIASALGVPEEVFRDAFSRVRPAPAGKKPDPEQVKRNKEALLTSLAPYGVTNHTLDKVSNYYRYEGSKGEVWKRRPAKAIAYIDEDGNIKFQIIDGGCGYTTPPIVTLLGKDVKIKATISFGKNFDKNGSVFGLTVIKR